MTRQSIRFAHFLLSLAVLCLLLVCGESRAGLDAETTTPYQPKVVLHLGDSPLLTEVFGEQVERGLQDYLQAAFRNLAHVKVERTHPQLVEVLNLGLKRALDNWKERSGTKTHFVLIDYVNGYYEIQARQHDGLTGQASPIVRTDRTRDRDLPARLAAILVEKDFGFVGSFDAWPGGRDSSSPVPVKLQLKGSGLNIPLDHWIQPKDVFQVVRIPDGDRTPQLVEGALLYVEKAPGDDGVCSCQLYFRFVYKPELEGDLAGFRCVRIATVSGPLRLRVIQITAGKRSPTVPAGVRVEIRRPGLQDNPTPQSLDLYGSFDSGNAHFDHMALVDLVNNGKAVTGQIPVPLVDNQPVIVQVDAAKGLEDGVLSFRRGMWKKNVADSYQVQASLFRKLKKQAADPTLRVQTIQEAKKALQRGRSDYDRLKTARAGLAAPGAKTEDLNTALALEDQMLQSIKEGEKGLGEFIVRQDEILRYEKSPERQAQLKDVDRAKALEDEAEYDQAIELYKKVVGNVNFPIAGVDKHLEELEKAWAIKSPEHAEARRFVYELWPKLDTDGLEAGITKALEYVKVLRAAADNRTPLKLRRGIADQVSRLSKEQSQLSDTNLEDENKLKTIKKVTDGLKNLYDEVEKLLNELMPPK